MTYIHFQALKLSHSTRKQTTVGEIVNLMSIDAQRVYQASVFLHEWWMSPLSIALSMYLLWLQLGPSAFAGLVLLVLLIPINGGYVSVKMASIQVNCGIRLLQKNSRKEIFHGYMFNPRQDLFILVAALELHILISRNVVLEFI